MVARRLERMVRQVRRWRSSDGSTPIPVDPTLGEADRRRLCRLIDDCIDAKGGELAARRRASAIAATFLTLDDLGRRRFFLTLAHDYDHDDAAVDTAVDALVRSRDPEDRRDAERRLAHALTPSRERLLQRFIGLEDGLSFVVDLREELRSHREGDPALTALDQELRHLLTDWFHLGILQLESITWDSPAALLEKLIEYEAVHEITSWADMKGRLGRGRRCYGFFHPLMPGEPLIFVEVAMTTDIAADLGPLLDHDADRIASQDAETANFYSISNCQRGLAGVPLGDMLIKQVAERLQADLPNLRRFATLSPIPGFRDWLIDALDDGAPAVLTEAEAELLAPGAPDQAARSLRSVVAAADVPPPASLAPLEPVLTRLAARYLVEERRGARALDPVAHFHLSNGARVERLNWMANPTVAGWERGLGLMVNYRYDLPHIEGNHDAYVTTGTVEAADDVRRLLTGGRP